VAEQRLVRARNQLTAAQTRLELGTVTQSDVLRAELEVGNAELAVLDAQSGLRNSALELGRQIGLSEAVHTAASALPEKAPPLPEAAALLAMAERSAPTVVAAEAALKSRHSERLAAYTPYLPTLRLTGGYDWFAFDWPPSQQSWSLRLVASLPVFNGFQRESSLQRAGAAERVAEARARDARNQARVSVEGAVAEIASAERRVQIADRAVGLAREDLRVIEERYGIGMVTILELQTSQVALSDAETAAVRARQALGTAIAQLESILGRKLTEG
jgi:outer membrane protein TolC